MEEASEWIQTDELEDTACRLSDSGRWMHQVQTKDGEVQRPARQQEHWSNVLQSTN